MKKMFTLLVVTLLSVSALAADATFFRVWQGYKRTDITASQFQLAIPDFMAAADQVYGSYLNDYFVAIPPVTKPAVVPDEFALLTFANEGDYRRIRATPEGQAYGTAHGDLFDMSVSKSAPYVSGLPATLVSGTAYDLSPAPLDWTTGYTLFFLGTRKAGIAPARFLADLHAHVTLARTNLVPEGMRGYIVVANEDYEAAYINWESEEAMTRAFARAEGQDVGTDARRFMDVLMWEAITPLKLPIQPGFYSSSRDPLF